MSRRDYQICTNCVMDTTDPEIRFDEKGRCDFCNSYYNNILPSWHPHKMDEDKLKLALRKIKENGKGRDYDCMIGLSGGVDSSYLVYLAAVEFGLRPIVVSVDTGWNSDAANENMNRIIEKLNLDFVKIIVDWDEMKDLQVAFLESQVPYQDTPQDHAIFAGLYNYAADHKVKYVLTGANYSTEGVKPPQEWTYLNDIRLIKDIHSKFGKIPLRTFPFCGMFRYRLYYRYFKGIRVVRLLNLVPYHKDKAMKVLEREFGWQAYDNKHYENIFTRFYEGYWLPKKFGYDKRRCYYSSLILAGQMDRGEALKLLAEKPYDDETAMTDLKCISDRLGMSSSRLLELMHGSNRTFRDYRNNEKILKAAIRLAMLVGLEKRNFRT